MFYKRKVVLVTGGTGFVGTHIVQELLRHEAKVRVPIHNRPLIIKDERIETIKADLTKQEDCLEAVKGVDYIFHAAGAVSAAGVTTSNPMAAITTNLILTAQILQAAWATNTDRILIFSSSTGYPEANYPIKEEEMWTGPTHPTYFGYGWMRRYLERLGEYVGSKSKVKVAIVRPTAVYGRWDNFDPKASHVVPALIRRAVEKENPYVVWGTGNEVRDFLHITDLARGCLLMLEKCANCDPVNIGYGKVVTVKEIVLTILKVAGNEKAEVIFDSTKPTTIPYRAVDTTKAKKILNFEPVVSLEEGLKDTVEWYKESINNCF
ncbi:MAG: NAD-dependent epimerase/dehydratase family protein [Gammaproteobacteria bacterium]|nr:NAD-dependent epimerase/dehydratase family protein [Gammaproteobacteria bacterium]